MLGYLSAWEGTHFIGPTNWFVAHLGNIQKFVARGLWRTTNQHEPPFWWFMPISNGYIKYYNNGSPKVMQGLELFRGLHQQDRTKTQDSEKIQQVQTFGLAIGHCVYLCPELHTSEKTGRIGSNSCHSMWCQALLWFKNDTQSLKMTYFPSSFYIYPLKHEEKGLWSGTKQGRKWEAEWQW